MFDILLDVVLDSFIDNLKILPFLFLTFLLMEYLEDKMMDKTRNVLKKTGKVGPLWGSLLGMVPQCGFSAAASNLYAGRVITMGTLISIYLSTSDEMLPILISKQAGAIFIVKILAIKVVIGILAGFIIDLFFSRLFHFEKKDVDIHHFCEHEHCDCGDEGIFKPALKHTIRIFIFIFLVSVIIGGVAKLVGLETISGSMLNNTFIGPLIAGLIGLIPNCAASVVITQLYLEGVLSFGTMIAGLLAGAGVGILVLCRVNDSKKENIFIISFLYVIGALCGMLLNLIF